MAATLTWLDLSKHGLALALGAVRDDPEFVVVGRRDAFEESKSKLEALGFVARGSHYYLPGDRPLPSLEEWQSNFDQATMNPNTLPGRVAKDRTSAIFMVENGWVDKEAMFPSPSQDAPSPTVVSPTPAPAQEPSQNTSGENTPTGNQSEPQVPADKKTMRWLSLAPYGLSLQFREVDQESNSLKGDQLVRKLVVLGGRQTENLYIEPFEKLGAHVDMDKAHGEFARIVFDVPSGQIGSTLRQIRDAFPLSQPLTMLKADVGGNTADADDILKYEAVEQIDWPQLHSELKAEVQQRVHAEPVTPFTDEELRDILQTASGLPQELVTRNAGISARRLQETLEAATVAVFRDLSKNKAELSVELAARIDTVMPKDSVRSGTSILLQQFSTPLAISYVLQDVLGVDETLSIYDATIGNGSLVSMAATENVSGIELDRDRLQRLKDAGYEQVIHGDAVRKDVPDAEFDRIVFNPPFGTFTDGNGPREHTSFVPMEPEGSQFPKMQVKSQDQYIALRHLKALKTDGLGALILGADHPMKFKEGEFSQETRNFLQFLCDTHDVQSMHYVSGKLYNSHGAGWPLLMIITGGRRESVVEYQLPDKLPIIASLSELDSYRLNMKEELVKWQREVDEQSIREPGQGGGGGRGNPETSDSENPEITGGGKPPIPESEKDEQSPDDVPAAIAEEEVAEAGTIAVDESAFDDFDDDAEESEVATRHAVDDAEVPYLPRSGMFSLNKMIPANIAGPINRALDKVEMYHGSIDSYVAEELGWTLEQLSGRLAAEQVDAVGLAMHQGTLDRGFILGDNTGIGKGRVMAAMVAWGIKKGKQPIFMTSKAGLFADIMRDFRDIGEADLLKPMVMNDIPNIKNSDGETVLKNTPMKDVQPLLAKNTIGPDFNCVFMTYSQINREMGVCKKAQWLTHAAEDNFLLLDEVHNGAGNDSNTGANLIEAIRAASFTLGASGTYAKRPDNLGLYIFTSMFDGTDAQTLMETVSAGGTEYQELLSTMLAESGQLIVRSHPEAPAPVPKLVDVSYDGVTGREITDQLAGIMNKLTALSAGTKMAVRDENEEVKKLMDNLPEHEKASARKWGSTTLNFGSIMHNVVRQAVLAMKAKGTVDAVKEAIEEGKRVVIGIDNTMEAFLQYAASAIKTEMLKTEAQLQGGESAEVTPGRDATLLAELEKGIPANISYRDTILRLMERLVTIERTDRYGNSTKSPTFDIEQMRQDYLDGSLEDRIAKGMGGPAENTALFYFNIEETVLELPEELPASPIDFMRQELENAGIITAEITGRSLQIDYSDPDNPVFKNRDSADRDRIRAATEFNEVECKVIFVNSSGAEGVSLHGHRDFRNNEDRRMIFTQTPYDIATYNQLSGRIDRSGAREGYRPDYLLLGLDIPAEKRQMANLIRKDSSLKANTRADREGKVEMYGVPMMNRVGDLVTYEVLRDHPDSESLARSLNIDLEAEEGKFSAVSTEAGIGNDTGLYSKVMSRLSLMRLADAEPLVEMFEDEYLRRIEILDQAGKNPLKTQILDLRARFTEEVYEITPKSGPSAFQASVDAKAIRFDQVVQPIGLDVVKASLHRSKEKMAAVSFGDYPLQDKWDEISSKQDREIERHGKKRVGVLYGELMEENLEAAPEKLRDYILNRKSALGVEDDVYSILRNVAKRHQIFQVLRDSIGLGVKVSGISLEDLGFETEQEKADFVITAIKPPKPVENPAAGSNWGITMMSPDGSAGMVKISLSQLMTLVEENPAIRFDQDPLTEEALAELFHEGREGYTVERERIVLMGNLFGAAEAAKKASEEYGDVGTANPVVFTDENGVKHRGMLMGAWFEVNDIEKLKVVDFTVSKPDVAKAYLNYIASHDQDKKAHELFSTNAWYSLEGARSTKKALQLGSGIHLTKDETTRQWKLRISNMKKDNKSYLSDGVLSQYIDGDFERSKDPLFRKMMEAPLKSNALIEDVIDRLMVHHKINFHGFAHDAEWYRDHLRNRGRKLEEHEHKLEEAMMGNRSTEVADDLPRLPQQDPAETIKKTVPAPAVFPGFG